MLMSGFHLPQEPHRQAKKRRIFHGIFPPAASASLPTPLATPVGSFNENTPLYPPSTQASPFPHGQAFSNSESEAFVTHSRAWHLATTFLSFPDSPFDVSEEESTVLGVHKDGVYLRRKADLCRAETREAMAYLMTSGANAVPGENLVEWYTCEVRRHFLEYIRPILDEAERDIAAKTRPEHQLNDIISQLRVTCKIYYSVYSTYLLPYIAKIDPIASVEPFHRSLASIISYCLPSSFPSLLRKTFYAYLVIILSLPSASTAVADVDLFTSPHIPGADETVHSTDVELELEDDEKAVVDQEEAHRRRDEARNAVFKLVDSLNSIGLMANSVGEREFAIVVDRVAGEWVAYRFCGRYTDSQLEVADADGDTSMAKVPASAASAEIMKEWLDGSLAPLVRSVMKIIHPGDPDDELPPLLNRLAHRLARVRIKEMFDIIVDFPASMPGIMDLIPTLNTSIARLVLTSTFAYTLHRRLLHQGASTVDILRAYINMIKCFQILDAKGVLLDRVGARVRRYLGSRDDTVVEIVKGILCYEYDEDEGDEPTGFSAFSPEQPGAVESVTIFKDSLRRRKVIDGDIEPEEEDILQEISTELQACAQMGADKKNDQLGAAAAASLEDLDFDDMEWQPDPSDAGPEYRRDKGTDIISHLFTMLEATKFINEFQNQLGKRLLLQPTSEFLREKATIELLKVRFGEAEMQNAAIMLKDLSESRKIDAHLRDTANRQMSHSRFADIGSTEVHLKVISRLFWPQHMITEGDFNLPPGIAATMTIFNKEFETFKKSRKLSWLKEEGFAVIELELSDRAFRFKQVPPYAATLIHTFGEPPNIPDPNIPDELNGGEVGNAWSIAQLEEKLSMDNGLIRKGLEYWTERVILAQYPHDRNIYYVMETLPRSDIPASRRTTPHTSPQKRQERQGAYETPRRRRRALSFVSESSTDTDSEDAGTKKEEPTPAKADAEDDDPLKNPRFTMAWNYIAGMLTNQGPMTTDRIFNTLSLFLIPMGGLQFDAAELDQFMMKMEENGRIDKTPAGWKMRKG
ncbi:hypothetical protein DRE_04008 [Drechslerella stenobrocha 248]|uniref:Anaphase-promoting complex subunit 2 n=1 Tax=Drechslerella stenobrocha 248 TaxID=1043628 RepID=W7I3J1_9PEZI|nr:hypothetical protein DRE_04008 [Drechslerella stenobrocha 248]